MSGELSLWRRLRWAVHPTSIKRRGVQVVCKHTAPGDLVVVAYRGVEGVGIDTAFVPTTETGWHWTTSTSVAK